MNKIMSGKDYYGMAVSKTLLVSAKMELYWDAFQASTPEQPDLDAMASVAVSIQDQADASGR